MVAVVRTQDAVAANATGTTFPRAARLLSPSDFARVLKTRPFRGQYLWIHRLDSNDSSNDVATVNPTDHGSSRPDALANAVRNPQLGLMIAKRNAKTAVLRNAIKRRIREQFRLRAARLPARAYVVRLSKSATKVDVPLIVGEWINSLELDLRKNSVDRPFQSGTPK
jgi:ribonuclease P protein component